MKYRPNGVSRVAYPYLHLHIVEHFLDLRAF